MDSAAHVLCVPDQLPKAVVITILSAGRGSHDPIMVPAASRSTFRDRISRTGRLGCRQLAHKSAECRDRQLGQFHQVYARDRQYAFIRRNETETLLVIINASDDPADVRIPVNEHLDEGAALQSLFGDLGTVTVCEGQATLQLPPRSSGILA